MSNNAMVKQYNIAYFYAEPQDSERLKKMSALNGETTKALVTQCLRNWLLKNRAECEIAITEDAIARGISPEEWAKIVLRYGTKKLPAYLQERTTEKTTPNKILPEIDTTKIVRHQLNYVLLSFVDYLHLQAAIIRDGDTAIGFISRVIKRHIDKNWEKFYAKEILENEKLAWISNAKVYMPK